jgi:hypothetical protein
MNNNGQPRELSDLDLVSMAKKNGIKLDGIFAKDELGTRLDKGRGSFIINLDDSDGPGTHWVAWKNGVYFDSYGLPPPLAVPRPIEGYNGDAIQSLNSEGCGWFCLYFLSDRPMDIFTTDPLRLWHNDIRVLEQIRGP